MTINQLKYKFYKTALFLAVENKNIEITRMLLDNKKIDINIESILKYYLFITYLIELFLIKFSNNQFDL